MKKFFSILGIIAGIALVVMGIVCLAGGFSGRVRTPETAASRSGYGIYNYKRGYANFGTDFYSYVNNNTAEAADAAQTTAENQIEIHELLRHGFGLMMLSAGLISICGFGVKLGAALEQNKKALVKTISANMTHNESNKELKEEYNTNNSSQKENATLPIDGQLTKLDNMLEKGMITQEEYDRRKKTLLGQ